MPKGYYVPKFMHYIQLPILLIVFGYIIILIVDDTLKHKEIGILKSLLKSTIKVLMIILSDILPMILIFTLTMVCLHFIFSVLAIFKII